MHVRAEKIHAAELFVVDVAQDLRPLFGKAVPAIAAAAGHRHRRGDKFERRGRACKPVEEPGLLRFTQHRAAFKIAVLARVEKKKLQSPAPAKRTVDPPWLALRTAHRPVV